MNNFLPSLLRRAPHQVPDPELLEGGDGGPLSDGDVKEGPPLAALSPQKGQVAAQHRERAKFKGSPSSPFAVDMSEHPDTMLRRIGLISQAAEYRQALRTRTARYDARIGKWYDQESGQVISDGAGLMKSSWNKAKNAAKTVAAMRKKGLLASLSAPSAPKHQRSAATAVGTTAVTPMHAWEAPAACDLQMNDDGIPTDVEEVQAPATAFDPLIDTFNHQDSVPNGVILVVGDLPAASGTPSSAYDCSEEDLRDLEALVQLKLRQTDQQQRVNEKLTSRLASCLSNVQQILLRKKAKSADSVSDDQQMLIANLGDEQDGKFMSDAEVQRIIRQYMVLSIPCAAEAVGAVVATSSVGAISSLLSEGIGMRTEHVIKSLLVVDAHEATVPNEVLVSQAANFNHVVRLARPPGHHVETPLKQQDVSRTLHSMVTELNRGYSSDRAAAPPSDAFHPRTVAPAPRKVVPVAVVACGGEQSLRFELLGATIRRWPILLIEGSGGYTDELITITRVLRDPTVPAEQREVLRHKLDAATFEITESADLIVINKGSVVSTVQQSITYAIIGDNTLRLAWAEYASWKTAAESYRSIYVVLLLVLVALGVFSTGLSVFQTVMQVVWINETSGDATQQDSHIGRMYAALNLVVIFLPLLIQLMQSVFNKINAGPKWAAYSWAAENCLMEIYLSRVQGKDYSPGSIRAASRGVAKAQRDKAIAKVRGHDADRNDDGRQTAGDNDNPQSKDESQQYSTRRQLLSIRLKRLSTELSSNVANTLTKPYEGPLPPREKRFVDDDGFSDLSSDDYVRLRLLPRLEMYKREVVYVSNVRVLLESCLHMFNTAGTVLGALATYEFLPNTNLQAWVAFTTSVVSALTRVEHWMLYEWKQRKYSQTLMKLSSVMSWWSSRGSQVASETIRSELCDRAESAILAELTEFSQQLRTASESVKKAEEEDYGEETNEDVFQGFMSGLDDALGGGGQGGAGRRMDRGKREMLRFVNELPLELITAENIEAAASDPKSFIGKQMKQLVNELNHEFGDVVGSHIRRMQELQSKVEDFMEVASSFRDIQHLVSDGMGCISIPLNVSQQLTVFDFGKLLSRPLRDLIETPHKRAKYLQALEGIFLSGEGSIQLYQLRAASEYVDRESIRPEMAMVPARLLLETARLALQEEATSQFLESLISAGITAQDITPKRGKLMDTLQALRPISFLPWRTLETQGILALLDDVAVRSTLKKNVSEAKLRSLIKRVEAFYRLHSDALALEADLLNEAVQMDVYNEIIGTSEGRILTSGMRANMRDLPVQPTLLSHTDLVALFNVVAPSTQHVAGAVLPTPTIPAGTVAALIMDPKSAGLQAVKGVAMEVAKGTVVQQLLQQLPRHVSCLPHEVLAEYVKVLSYELPANTCVVAAAWSLACDLHCQMVARLERERLQRQRQAGSGGVLSTFQGSMNQRQESTKRRRGDPGTAFIKSVEPIFVVSGRVDELATFVLSMTQAEILQSRKEQLLKRLLGSTGAKELVDILRTIEGDGLKQVLCVAHCLMGDTYVGEIFDRLSFEMRTFDPSKVLNYEEQILLMGRLSEFADDSEVVNMSTEDILRRLALRPLNQKLKHLKAYQLCDLLIRLRTAMFPLFSDALKRRLMRALGMGDPRRRTSDVVARAESSPPLQWYILVHCLGRMDTRRFEYFCAYMRQRSPLGSIEMPKRHEWIQLIPDRDVQRMINEMKLELEDVKMLCVEAAEYVSDAVNKEALERVATEYRDDAHLIDTLEHVFGIDARLKGFARDCFFASLALLVGHGGIGALTVAESLSRLDPDSLLTYIKSTIASAPPEVLHALEASDIWGLCYSTGRPDLSRFESSFLPRGQTASRSQRTSPQPQRSPGMTVLRPHQDSRATTAMLGACPPSASPTSCTRPTTPVPDAFDARMVLVHVELHQQLAGRYPIFLSTLMSAIMTHGPIYMFNEVARGFNRQDLRQVFDTMHSRTHLSMFCLWRWDQITNALTIRQQHDGSVQSEDVCTRSFKDVFRSASSGAGEDFVASPMQRGLSTSLSTSTAVQQSGGTAAAERNSKQWQCMGRTMDDLQEIPEVDTCAVLELAMHVLAHSRVGQIFILVSTVARNPSSYSFDVGSPMRVPAALTTSVLTTRDDEAAILADDDAPVAVLSLESIVQTQLLTVATAMMPQIAMEQHAIYERFSGFQEKVFVAQSLAAKTAAFKQFVFDDGVAAFAAQWHEEALAQFFSYMRCRPPYIVELAATSLSSTAPIGQRKDKGKRKVRPESAGSGPNGTGGGTTTTTSASGNKGTYEDNRKASTNRISATIVAMSRILAHKPRLQSSGSRVLGEEEKNKKLPNNEPRKDRGADATNQRVQEIAVEDLLADNPEDNGSQTSKDVGGAAA